jgi:microsomal dipeptidase-like Zn-dependent dipeptidase
MKAYGLTPQNNARKKFQMLYLSSHLRSLKNFKTTIMDSFFFADLHCHPSIKAYARSFRDDPNGMQSPKPSHHSSIWRTDSPSVFDKLKNYVVSLTNFIQSDGTSLLRGKVGVVCLSFYPQEKGFFVNKAGSGFLTDTLTKLASEFGQQRIDHIQSMQSYWEDFKMETAFLLDQENARVKVDGRMVTYSIARSYADVEQLQREGELGETAIVFIPTIEGGHVFDQVMDSTVRWDTHPKGVADDRMDLLLERVGHLRDSTDGVLRPAFITLAHHFWNGLCGHSSSLGSIVKCIVDQKNGVEQGLTIAGREVIKKLLEERINADGVKVKPIIIDIKHMSRKSRQEYFQLLDTEFPGTVIPVLASHAGVTGLPAPGQVPQTPAAQEGLYMSDDINLYDDEILKIGQTGGLFGIQLDERRIGSVTALREARGNIRRRDILYAWAKLVWNQVRHVAEVLDMHDLYAWDIQSLGSDFDGLIDPINGYWTARNLDNLDDYLLKHAFNYLKEVKVPCPLKQVRNKSISPEELVDRVMTSNILSYLSRNY